jgi:hypothetical protein
MKRSKHQSNYDAHIHELHVERSRAAQQSCRRWAALHYVRLKSILITVGVAGTTFYLQAQPAPSAEATNSDHTVAVHYEKDIPIPKAVAQELQSETLEMIRTANYNSRMPHQGVWRRPEPVSKITQHYRELVATGKYVLVVWAQPQKVQTVLGETITVETIVELEKPGVWMCNVDDEGRLVHLGKFRRDILTKMEKLVKQLVK